MSNIAVSLSGAASNHRARTGACVAAAVALLSGCSAGSSAKPEVVVTVTTTPTVTATAAPPTTAAPTRAEKAKSDVVGRAFDLGTIVRVRSDDGVPVIVLDRWTAQGVADQTLAAQGVPIHVHADAPYQNLNNTITYRIPVAQDATFTYKHCVAIDQPPVQRSSTLDEFAQLQDPEKVVLLTLDPEGQAVRAQNDPAC